MRQTDVSEKGSQDDVNEEHQTRYGLYRVAEEHHIRRVRTFRKALEIILSGHRSEVEICQQEE